MHYQEIVNALDNKTTQTFYIFQNIGLKQTIQVEHIALIVKLNLKLKC